ncbi:MAG: hypothetical protein QM673_10545 [Gordonia sp. (in: high G+C Gram-positive bacteria)]
MRINVFPVRATMMIGGGAALLLGIGSGVGGGDARAATQCSAVDGHAIQRIEGRSGCGARAGADAVSYAEDASSSGTAVAVSDEGGRAAAYNVQPGSTALAGANSGGNAYSVTTGPGALSVAQARRGGVSVSVGGWGGQAYAGPAGAQCHGGFAAAADSISGQACVASGAFVLHN